MTHLLLLLLPMFFTIAFSAEFDNSTYPDCPTYSCGNVNISYPFWSINHQSPTHFCGYQGFGINCSGVGDQAISQITLGGDAYYVWFINYEVKTIFIADYDVSSVATVPRNCPRVRHNIDLETLPLDYSMYTVNLSFHYNCTDCPSFARPIPCLNENGRSSCVHSTTDSNSTDESDWEEYSCSEEVVTTVFADLMETYSNLSRDYGRILERGFGLRWWTVDVDDCANCERSGGHCGHNNTTGFRCFCPNGTVTNGDCEGTFVTTIKF